MPAVGMLAMPPWRGERRAEAAAADAPAPAGEAEWRKEWTEMK